MLVHSRQTGLHQGSSLLAILTLSALLVGCTNPPTRHLSAGHSAPNAQKPTAMTTPAPAPALIPDSTTTANPTEVVRNGRYTLTEVTSSGQEDLMQQIVDIAIPASLPATVGDALRYVLERSGYRLCQGSDETTALNALPLPAAHLHLGPLKLREALRILIGPARALTVDESTREVCIRPHALPPPVKNPQAISP